MATPIDPSILVDPSDYEIMHFVSAGTFGTVMQARCRSTGELCACKFFDYTSSPSEARYVDQEIQRQVEVVDIEGIVKIKGVFLDTVAGMLTGMRAKDEKGHFTLAKRFPRVSKVIVMELLNGGELFDKVAAKGAFSEEHASVILESVARAFAAMHARRRINRDFKLENCVFVHADPERLECKIIDLGFVKALPEGSDVILENRHVGTEKFLAPESRMRPGATDMSSVYSPATDVWQLGCFLHIMVCLHMPWDERGKEVPKPGHAADGHATARRGCSAHAKDLMARMFAADPAQRITIAEILAHPFVAARSELSQTDLGPQYQQKVKDLHIRKRFRGMLQACTETGRRQRERVLHLETHSPTTGLTGLHITDLHFSQLRQAYIEKTGTHDLANASLDKRAFQEVLRTCGLGALASDAVFEVFDEDGSGGIDYYEFVVTLTAFRAPHGATGLDAQLLFDLLDLNSDQRVTFSEIKAVLGVLLHTHEIVQEDLCELFDVMDNDHSQEISIHEFRKFIEVNTSIVSHGTTVGGSAGAGAASAAGGGSGGSGAASAGASPSGSPPKVARKVAGSGITAGIFGFFSGNK